MNEHYQELTRQYFDRCISDEGLNELRDWMDQNPEHEREFRETIKVLEEGRNWFKTFGDKEKVWSKIESGLKCSEDTEIKTARKGLKVFYYAAASIAVILTGLHFSKNPFKTSEKPPREYVYFHNGAGRRSKLVLPDSSILHLNSESSVRFSKSFKEDIREIELSGEAYFEVVHNQEKPFIVSSGAIKTTVLGTSFNIKAFPDDRKVAVTVASGKVGVSMASTGGQKFLQFLLPGQQLDINTITGDYSFNTINTTNATAWKNSKLVLENQSLDEIATTLSRWYNIKTVLADPENTHSKYTAKFDNMPLREVMDILVQLTGCSYTIQANRLIINNKNCK
ncbi:FecR family protein [Desertivirga brevis]|uniref:FecR family protein n=1 Tax=Desertivirga brevis TaxID=2810310 RepID=UPI001A967DAF|nr:FecR family protein [Pedobacter sp. SYSU D00873]